MIYLYYGANTFLREEKLRLFKERYVARFPHSLNVHGLDISEGGLGPFKEVCEGRSLFDETVLAFVSGTHDISSASLEELFAIVENTKLSQRKDIVVVFSSPLSGKNINKSLLNFFNKHGHVQEYVPYTGKRLLEWAIHYCDAIGGKISKDAAELLIKKRGEDMLALSHELSKLTTYSNGEEVKNEAIEDLVFSVQETDVFQTVDALARKKGGKALSHLLDHKRKGDDPFQVMGMFAYQVRTLLLIKDASARKAKGKPAVANNLHPFVIKKNTPLSASFETQELIHLHALIADADLKSKTGEEDAYSALEDVVLTFL